MLYAGLDLGGKRTRVHVRNAEGQAVHAGWAHDLGELKKIVDQWGPDLSVAMEATTGAFFIYDELCGRVAKVKVAHPRDLRAIAHARIKNDRLDAEKLSELNRGDLIPEVWIPSAKVRFSPRFRRFPRRIQSLEGPDPGFGCLIPDVRRDARSLEERVRPRAGRERPGRPGRMRSLHEVPGRPAFGPRRRRGE